MALRKGIDLVKTITMPYEEYQADLKRVENEIFHEKVAPVLNLIEVCVGSERTMDGVPRAYWKFQGTVEELLDALCKIHGVANLHETRETLRRLHDGRR